MSAPMGAAPGRESFGTVECSICGRENPAGRSHCLHCKQRLSVSPSSLERFQNQNQELRAQNESLQQELDNSKAASAKAEASHSVLAEVHDKLKAAEGNVAMLEQRLAAKANEFEELVKSHGGQNKPEESHSLLTEVHGKLKAAEETTAKWISHAMGLEGKFKTAEGNVAMLQQQLVDKAKEVQELSRSNSETNKPGHLPSLLSELQDKLKAAEEKAATWASQATALEGKWKASERTIAALANQLADKAREIQELSKGNTGTKPRLTK